MPMNIFLKQSQSNQGVTLLEILITIVVIGILATLSVPNVVAMFSKSNLSEAVQTIQSSLQDSQRQAMRRSNKCNIILNAATSPMTVTSPTDVTENSGRARVTVEPKNYDCLLGGSKTFPEGIAIASNLRINDTTNPKKSSLVQFSSKGQPITLAAKTSDLTQVDDDSATKPAVIIIAAEGVKTAKCIVISPVIGLVRTGEYKGDMGSNPYQWVQGYAPNNTTALPANPENSCEITM